MWNSISQQKISNSDNQAFKASISNISLQIPNSFNDQNNENQQSANLEFLLNKDIEDKNNRDQNLVDKKKRLKQKIQINCKDDQLQRNKPKIYGTKTMRSTIKEGHNFVQQDNSDIQKPEKEDQNHIEAITYKNGQQKYFVASQAQKPKRGRGRPPKLNSRPQVPTEQGNQIQVLKRGRGRPPKISKIKQIQQKRQISKYIATKKSRNISKSRQSQSPKQITKQKSKKTSKNSKQQKSEQKPNVRKRGRPLKSKNSVAKNLISSSNSSQQKALKAKPKKSIALLQPNKKKQDESRKKTKIVKSFSKSSKSLTKKVKRS